MTTLSTADGAMMMTSFLTSYVYKFLFLLHLSSFYRISCSASAFVSWPPVTTTPRSSLNANTLPSTSSSQMTSVWAKSGTFSSHMISTTVTPTTQLVPICLPKLANNSVLCDSNNSPCYPGSICSYDESSKKFTCSCDGKILTTKSYIK